MLSIPHLNYNDEIDYLHKANKTTPKNTVVLRKVTHYTLHLSIL
jgi:hypothetical protein